MSCKLAQVDSWWFYSGVSLIEISGTSSQGDAHRICKHYLMQCHSPRSPLIPALQLFIPARLPPMRKQDGKLMIGYNLFPEPVNQTQAAAEAGFTHSSQEMEEKKHLVYRLILIIKSSQLRSKTHPIIHCHLHAPTPNPISPSSPWLYPLAVELKRNFNTLGGDDPRSHVLVGRIQHPHLDTLPAPKLAGKNN